MTHDVLQHSDRMCMCVFVCAEVTHNVLQHSDCMFMCVFVCAEVTHNVLQHSDRVCVCVCLCVQRSCDRKVNEFVKRARAAKIHILIVSVVGGCEWV